MTNFLKKSLSASLKMLVAILTFFTSACITLYVCFAINPSATLKAITGTSLQFAGAAKTSAVILAKQDDGYSLKIKSINFLQLYEFENSLLSICCLKIKSASLKSLKK